MLPSNCSEANLSTDRPWLLRYIGSPSLDTKGEHHTLDGDISWHTAAHNDMLGMSFGPCLLYFVACLY